MSGRRLLGPEAPSEEDSRLMALTIISGGLDVGTMWLSGDLDVERDRLIDFMTEFVLSSTRLRAPRM
jgi:hypothetical protein